MKTIIKHTNRPCGAMDNASAYGAEDSRFESWQDRIFFFEALFLYLFYMFLYLLYMVSNFSKMVSMAEWAPLSGVLS